MANQLPRLGDVLNFTDLQTALDGRLVRRQTHPTLPLAIYNYTQTAQWSRTWTDVTVTCRGLITSLTHPGADSSETETVVARPWRKFFNLAEHSDADIPNEAVTVTDKMDGSLGILVPTPDGYVISTRGSFTSDQAQHATELLTTRYNDWTPQAGWTYLFEIIYPGNRIVVDYADLDDLVLLGAVDISDGRSVPLADVAPTWPGPVVEQFRYTSLADALTQPPRPNREGLVVHFVDSDLRVKLKQDDYVALHKVLTGLNERRVWEIVAEHGSVEPLLELVPDEMFDWVNTVSTTLHDQHRTIVNQAHADLTAVCAAVKDEGVHVGDPGYRKTFAAYATKTPRPGLMFSLLDGRDITAPVWALLRPDATGSPFVPDENNN